MRLSNLQGFGELALHCESVRNSSAIAEKEVGLIVLTREAFLNHSKSGISSDFNKIIDFFRYFPPYFGLPDHEIEKFAAKASITKYPGNTLVLRQDDIVKEFYYIRIGKVQVIRRVKFRIDCITKKMIPNAIENPYESELNEGIYQNILLDLDQLGNGASFGDFSALAGDISYETYITSSPSEIIILPAYEIKHIFSPQTLKTYKSLVKSYPTDSELREVHHDTLKWKNWKFKIVENVYIDKANNKMGYSTALRKPLLRLQKLMPMNFEIKTMMPVIEHKKLIFGEPPDGCAIKNLHRKAQSMKILKKVVGEKNKNSSSLSLALSSKILADKNSLSPIIDDKYMPHSVLVPVRKSNDTMNEFNNGYIYNSPQHKKKQDSVIVLNETTSKSPEKDKSIIMTPLMYGTPIKNQNSNFFNYAKRQNQLGNEMSFLQMQRSILLENEPLSPVKSFGANKNILISSKSIKLPQIVNSNIKF